MASDKSNNLSSSSMRRKAFDLELTRYYHRLFLAGVPLDANIKIHLYSEGFIDLKSNRDIVNKITIVPGTNRYKIDELSAEDHEKVADSNVDIIVSDKAVSNNGIGVKKIISDKSDIDDEILTAEEYYDLISSGKVSYVGKDAISKADWLTTMEQVAGFDPEFFRWINAINEDFTNIYKVNYNKFNLYRQQAYGWLSGSDNIVFPVMGTKNQKINYLKLERFRCVENSLYGVTKFGQLKLGHVSGGSKNFKAWPVQEYLLYLFDCMLSYLVAKARQIGSTSVILAASILRTMLRKSYITKFVTEKGKKGEEIMDDKVKFILSSIPTYMKPSVSHDAKDIIRFSRRVIKGHNKGANSKFVMEPPYPTVVNGGSPDTVLIDESGLIPIIDEILSEGRPTMFLYNRETSKMEIVRQIIGWGTGGNMEKSGHVYESEMRAAYGAWMDKDFSYGFVPIVIDTFARPGVTKEFYEKEKKNAYRKTGPKSHIARMKFHQSFPLNLDDMFLRSSDTIIPIADINEEISKINKLPDKFKPVYGYFEPVYDKSFQYDEYSDVPYRIAGATFVPGRDGDTEESYPVTMFMDVEDGWIDRYFGGTDPLLNPGSGGTSKFSSSIWDNYKQTVSCIVNWKPEPGGDYREPFLQSLLMQIYYAPKSTRELIEENAGKTYESYVEAKGFWGNFISNSELPDQLHTSSVRVGLKKEGVNKRFIIHKLDEMVTLYKKNIYIKEFWTQLKTFVKKVTTNGSVRYEPRDVRYFNDDVIDSVVYSYICAKSFSKEPRLRSSITKKKVKRKIVCNSATGYNISIMGSMR